MADGRRSRVEAPRGRNGKKGEGGSDDAAAGAGVETDVDELWGREVAVTAEAAVT